MSLAEKVTKFEHSDAVVVLDCTCPECDGRFSGADRSGGHCRGGAYGGCCKSFRSLGGFDKHRVGPFDGDRRCLTADELAAAGWSVDDDGLWRMPAPAVSPWGAK